MIYEYKKDFNISYSTVDRSGKLGLVELMNLNQDMITEYLGSIKSDNKTLREKYSAAWIYTRTKAKLIDLPFWNTKTQAKTFLCSKSPIRIELETDIFDEKEKLLCALKTEMCAIDFEARKICPLAKIEFPEEMETGASNIPEPFDRMKFSFEDSDTAYSQKVFASDTDFTNHTNNARYVKYLMNTFEKDFYDSETVTGFEIAFSKESQSGDELQIWKKENESNEFVFQITKTGETVVKAALQFSDEVKVWNEI